MVRFYLPPQPPAGRRCRRNATSRRHNDLPGIVHLNRAAILGKIRAVFGGRLSHVNNGSPGTWTSFTDGEIR
jgi:hypothetical protein